MEDFGNQYKDSSAKYMQGELPPLPSEFDNIIKSLDKERAKAAKKTKGMFKKTFFISWLSLFSIGLILNLIFATDRLGPLIGMAIMGAAVSAIGAGIYTLLKKGNVLKGFSSILKKELVSKIIKEVNPALDFYEKGITKEVYDTADLIDGVRFESEDSIKGKTNGLAVIISECKLTRQKSTTVSGKHDSSTNDNGSVVSFNGIFIQLELSTVNLSTPLKIIPNFAVETNFDKLLNLNPLERTRYAYKRINIEEEEQISIAPNLEKSDYTFFCKDKSVADSFINQARLKVLDFIFDKYKDQRASILDNIPLLKEIDATSGVYISIVGNTLNLALDWNEDLFEPDALLKEGIEESGLAQKIYRDLHFINQIVNELSLIDKVNG